MGLFSWLTGGANKRADELSKSLPSYSGYRPPRVTHLRPVEDQITEILMQRSKDIGTGYNPERRNELQDIYNIDNERRAKREDSDIQNRISGMGLSRNPAVYDELLGRARADREADKSIYTKSINAEDLAVKNQEKREATAGLQDLNAFNFGQENNAANFDLDVYGRETGNELQRRGIALGTEAYRESPLSVGLAVADAASNFVPNASGGGSSKKPVTPVTTSPTGRYESPNDSYGSGSARSNYLNQQALKKGYNFSF